MLSADSQAEKRGLATGISLNEIESKVEWMTTMTMLGNRRERGKNHYRKTEIPWSWDTPEAECVTNAYSYTIIHNKTQIDTQGQQNFVTKMTEEIIAARCPFLRIVRKCGEIYIRKTKPYKNHIYNINERSYKHYYSVSGFSQLPRTHYQLIILVELPEDDCVYQYIYSFLSLGSINSITPFYWYFTTRKLF
jgi:hypothetical protein